LHAEHWSQTNTIATAERIRTARELRGLTQRETTTLMTPPITPAALSQIEAGKVRASPATVAALAEALQVPTGFFAGRRSQTPVPFFRDLRATPARERRRAAALALLLHDVVLAMEDLVRFPDVKIPQYTVPPTAGPAAVAEVAEAVRGEWDLGDGPVSNVVRDIERHGVPVARLALGHASVDAFAAWFPHRPLVLLSADKQNYVRSRFDAAHELGHLVMHRGAEPGDKILERQAHHFATCFLLPEVAALDELPRRLDGQGWLQLAALKQHWGMSMSALLMRTRSLELLSAEAHRNAMRYMSARGWRTVEPGDREMGLPEAPVLLERAVARIEAESGITLTDLAERAGLPVADTVNLVKAAMDARPAVEL
jgi:Zn-dependent peptidase ImmA (M78 family)/transcriptional regulator with XRE-family HTH domain